MTGSPQAWPTRKPWLAALLNLLFPGLGLVYAGSIRSGGAWALAPTIAALTVAAILSSEIGSGVSLLLIGMVLFGAALLGARAAWRAAQRAPRPFRPGALNNAWAYLGIAALLTFANASFHKFIFQPFFVQAFMVPGHSMEPTLLAGDYMWVVKARHAPPARDLPVVFESVEDSSVLLIKRIVALSGDTIAIRAGQVIRNGSPVAASSRKTVTSVAAGDTADSTDLTALQHRLSPTTSTRWTLSNWGPIVVPANEMFVLGDSPHDSYDSRYYGPIPVSRIRGWPRLVYFSRDSSGIRWNRVGHSVMP